MAVKTILPCAYNGGQNGIAICIYDICTTLYHIIFIYENHKNFYVDQDSTTTLFKTLNDNLKKKTIPST